MTQGRNLIMKSIDEFIVDVLKTHSVKNQTQLVKLLKQKGIPLDQSTLSRRLKALGIRKKEGYYRVSGRGGLEGSSEVSQNWKIKGVYPNLIVVRTLPGHAQALAFRLDQLELQGMAGTIAGDDTLLCIVDQPTLLEKIRLRIQMLSEEMG
jgi:transcriptional regulator of arginine metabolism